MKKFRHLITGIVFAISALCSCEPKEELKLPEVGLPTVTEQEQGTLKFTSAVVTNGNPIQEYGFYYGTTTPPATRVPGLAQGSEFSASVTVPDIAPGTPVFVKSYVIIASGTISSDVVSYTTKTIPAEQVILSDDELAMSVGNTYTLTAQVLPENTTDVLSWENSNPKIVELSQNGELKAIKQGQAIITAKAGTKTAVCLVTVGAVAESVALDKTEMTIARGETVQLSATVTPADVAEPVTWTSSNEEVASVSDGRVTGVKAGKATITAAIGDKSASCEVTVLIPSEGVTISKTELDLKKGEWEQLTATVTPEDATDKLEWSSSNDAVAPVTPEGRVTAVGGGEAVITAKAGNMSATCKVRVSVPVTSVSVKPESATLYVGGESLALQATVLPEDADIREVVWESGNTAVATVDANGKVSPVAEGTAVITATAKGTDKSASCTVTVTYKDVESVVVSPSTMSLYTGEKGSLTATVQPEYAKDKTVTWASADESIATVSQNGQVTAVAIGTVEITATAGQKTGKCTVNVISRLVTSVTLDKSSLSMTLFTNEKLTATVTPSDAIDGEVEWTSSDPEVASVDENGNVSSLKPGTTVITAKAGNYSASCNVTVNKIYNVGTDQMEKSRWTSDYSDAVLNVLPPSGSYGAIYAQYNADLNLYFSTDNGWAIRLDKRLTGYKFVISPEMLKVTDVGGVKVKFEIENEFILRATVDGKTEKVAELFVDETSHYYRRDHLTFNKSSVVAQKLLSTGQFRVYLALSTMYGLDKIDIYFNGKDHFKMFLNPPLHYTAVTMTPTFVHGVKYGEEGTYLNMDNMVRLVDWRDVSFNAQPLLWDYYGEFDARLDTETAYWTLNGAEVDPPAGIEIEGMDPEDGDNAWGESNLGFVTYLGTGAYPGAYHYHCRIRIEYGFATLYTDYIKIKIVKQ